MTCHDVDQSLALYPYNELRADERTAIEEHITACEACRRAMEQSRRLEDLLSEHPAVGPTPDLLVQCRQRLEDALDQEQMGWRALIREWLPPVAAAHPARAMGALTLVALGFSLGWILHSRVGRIAVPASGAAQAQMAGGDLGSARINSISQVAPDPQTGDVRITLNAEKRVTMEGSLDDPHIRDVMVYALKSYDNPGIRLDTLSALRLGSSDPTVRDALLYALEHDQNAGVRLEALRTVGKANWNSDVAHAFLQAAENDPNLGVREAAIDSLVGHVSTAGDDDLVPALQQLATQDSDRYVRIKSMEALHQMGQQPY
ncbi:MAG TPA: HEAT repeat domain-containing protein [Terriglobia bacterium]